MHNSYNIPLGAGASSGGAKRRSCEYVLVPNDGVFGNNDSGKWTGVVGMVHRGEVDVGIAHFTPTRYRKEVVDFAYPLMHAT